MPDTVFAETKKCISTYLTPSMHADFERLCQEEGVSMSTQLRLWIIEALRSNTYDTTVEERMME